MEMGRTKLPALSRRLESNIHTGTRRPRHRCLRPGTPRDDHLVGALQSGVWGINEDHCHRRAHATSFILPCSLSQNLEKGVWCLQKSRIQILAPNVLSITTTNCGLRQVDLFPTQFLICKMERTYLQLLEGLLFYYSTIIHWVPGTRTDKAPVFVEFIF